MSADLTQSAVSDPGGVGALSKSKRVRMYGIAAVVAITVTIITGGVAYADPAPDEGVDVLTAISDASPDTLAHVADTAPTETGDTAIEASAGTTAVTVPTDPSDAITVDAAISSISVGLPFSDTADSAKTEANGVVSYDNNNGSITVPVVKTDASVEITTVISSSSAPTRYGYTVSVPEGGILSQDSDGIVSVLDSAGGWIAGFAPAWANDANGSSVLTHYEIDGSTLVQVVDLSSPDIAFPVVADPWLGIALIDHTTWGNLWQYSPSLQVFPTWWGRYGAGIAADGAAWAETLSKTARAGHPNPNTSTMQVQFDCHFQVVRLKSPGKPSWNLDTKLPWTDFANEVRYGCNYPTGNREF